MGQVSVTIAGKSYRMACGDGEEAHLEGLAALLDQRVAEMHEAFGEIGDMRLHVMAAISIADETAELRRKVSAL
ncbi:MAG: cell division protein ZapA, partial [Bosea sp. (in: a-proteobacteria)]